MSDELSRGLESSKGFTEALVADSEPLAEGGPGERLLGEHGEDPRRKIP
ncbi:MAG TPA: hypothetical protein PLV66_15515 [Thermoanaerobaculales bacterium]|nr:hypothetical protein [Thermoanaerobaculales bacterium]